VFSCQTNKKEKEDLQIQSIKDPHLVYENYEPQENDIRISRADYFDQLQGFWLGQCIESKLAFFQLSKL